MEDERGKGRILGIFASILMNGCVVLVCCICGLPYLDPPPAEMGVLMEFEPLDDEPQKIEVAAGVAPRSEVAHPDREINLVQRSEGPAEAKRENLSEEATVGDQGDVEVPEEKRPVEINKRALFPSANNNQKDTLAQQAADKASEKLTAGHSQGNTRTGNPEGVPSAQLAGRSVMGSLPIPSYSVQKSGKVVVRISVDRDGNVTSAIAGDTGTTVSDNKLWKEAEKAARNAKFNISRDAPESQTGTITYIFKLQ